MLTVYLLVKTFLILWKKNTNYPQMIEIHSKAIQTNTIGNHCDGLSIFGKSERIEQKRGD